MIKIGLLPAKHYQNAMKNINCMINKLVDRIIDNIQNIWFQNNFVEN